MNTELLMHSLLYAKVYTRIYKHSQTGEREHKHNTITSSMALNNIEQCETRNLCSH